MAKWIAFYIKTKHKHQKQLKVNSKIEKALVALVTNDANNAVTSTYFNVLIHASMTMLLIHISMLMLFIHISISTKGGITARPRPS